MAKQKINYLDLARKKAKEKADSGKKPSNEKEFTPKDAGKYRIRLLPPLKADEGQLPYHTHSFHYLPNIGKEKKGEYVYSKKQYGTERDPIDKAVSEMYDTKEEALKSEAGKIKRKRNSYWNAIVYDADGNPTYKVLRDTTNEGKLTRILCQVMGIPFFRDVEDNWVGDEETQQDEDRPFVDLLDIEEGHDFFIVKKVTGKNPWDFNFESSYASQKSRPLTDEEKALLNERVDLETYIDYIEDIEVVKTKLEEYLSGDEAITEDDEEEEVKPATRPASKTATRPAPKKTSKTVIEDDIDIDDLSEQLDD